MNEYSGRLTVPSAAVMAPATDVAPVKAVTTPAATKAPAKAAPAKVATKPAAPKTVAPPPPAKVDPNAPVTMNGCVTRDYTDSKNASAYTFMNDADGSRYRLSGKSVSKYSGMLVQVTGIVDTKKLKVVGALLPSPNIAAQAGAISPERAAEAAMPGGAARGTGTVTLPELRVKIIRTLPGSCP